jgi:CheY-like chemotaxis protein
VALFERLRRGGNRRARGEEGEASSRVTVADLAERLVAIRDAAAAPEDALEPALETVVEASGAVAGAVCLYDVRQCILRLTAEVGLSDEGCQQLRTVRRADPACWDIPLHGLLNRRAYLIESASRNRYVPKLVEARTALTTVICIPMFAGMTPLGSLVLVSAAPRTFTQRDIETLWAPLRSLTSIIEEIRRRVNVSAPSGDLPVIDPVHIERSALAAERDQLLSELAARRAEGERLASALEEQIATVAQLRTELEKARTESQLLEREAARTVTLPDDDAVRAHLAGIERERDDLRTSLARSEEARAELERREAALEAARTRAEAAATEAAEAARVARESGAKQDGEAERVRAELEAEVARLTDRAAGLERDLTAAAAGSGESAALAQRVDDLEARLDAAGREVAEARRALEEREATVVRLRGESQGLEERCAEQAARLGALDDELTLARSERDQARQAEQARAGELAELRTTIEVLTGERDAAATRAASADEAAAMADRQAERVAELERLLAQEREAKAGADGELTALRGQLEAAAAAEATRSDTTAQLHAEIAQLRETCERLQRERGDLAQAHDAALARLSEGSSPSSITMGVTSMFETDLESGVDDAVTVISVPPEPLTPIIESGSMPLLVIIDSDEAWKSIEIEGYEIYVAPPDTDAAAAVAALDPVRIVANLASGVVNTLGALRKAGSKARFWGCIADAGAGRALPLGMIEPVIPPLDPDVVIAKLGPYANRGSRLVTIGTDVDALMSLRQALARRQVSVSMAWDAKQGMDLIHQARPDAMLVDLDLPKKDGYALVVRAVAQIDPPPYTLLVGGRSGSGKGFKDALASLDDDGRVQGLEAMLIALSSSEESVPLAKEGRRHKRVPYGKSGRDHARRRD